MSKKIKGALLGVFIIATILLTVGAFGMRKKESVKRSDEIHTLNEIYEYSVPDKLTSEQTEPEKSLLTIMYFHLLHEEVDEGTFFNLKERTVEALSSSVIDVIPEGFEESRLTTIRESKSAVLLNMLHADNLLIYEVLISEYVVRFKYMEDENRLFSELKEVEE